MISWTTANAVIVLNDLLQIDPLAISRLFLQTEVETNKCMANYPTVQVGQASSDSPYILRPLGLINGLLPKGEVIMMNLNEDLTMINSFSAAYITPDGQVINLEDQDGKCNQ